MDLPIELFPGIRDNLTCITDVRNLSRTCKPYNKLCKRRVHILKKQYAVKYCDFKFVSHLNRRSITVEKFTVEIILDGYVDLLPEKYYNAKNSMMCSVLAFRGYFKLLKIAYKKLCPLTNYTFNCATHNGNLNILKWIILHNNEIYCEGIYQNASRQNHIHILQWMLTHGHKPNKQILYDEAVSKGNVDVLQWMLDNKYSLENESILCDGAYYGNINIIKWGIYCGFKNDKNFCDHAAKGGSCNVLDWALRYNHAIDYESIFNKAIKYNKVKVLQWLLKHKYEINYEKICDVAIKNNRMEMFEWALKTGYKIPNSFSSVINDNNAVKFLQWMVDNNCEIDPNILENAITTKNTSIIEWMISNKLITNPIVLPILPKYKSTIELLLQHNLFAIDTDIHVKLLNNKISIPKDYSKTYLQTKKQYHFIIENDKIKKFEYGKSMKCTKQKIIYFGPDGEISACNFDCDNHCWWDFLAYCIYSPDKKIIRKNINKCDLHKKFSKYLI